VENVVVDAMKLGAAILLAIPVGLFLGAMMTALIRDGRLRILAMLAASACVSVAYVMLCGWGLADYLIAKQIAFVGGGLLITTSIGLLFAGGLRQPPR
jgi:hypothetical protein